MKKNGLLVCIILLLHCGCCKKEERNKASSRVINTACCSPISSLDPRVGNEFPSALAIRMLYDGLMRLGPNGEIVPALAERYEISSDQRTYTFYIRSAKWSNGDEVTAYDFEYAWKKSVDPKTICNGAFTFHIIKNVPLCLAGKVSVDEIGVRALGEKILQIELEHPAPYFLSILSFSTYAPINKKIDLIKKDWANEAGEYLTTNGPFYVAEWKKREYLLLKKNPLYWDHERVKIAGINIQYISDTATQFYLFEQGKLDWTGEPFSPLSTDLITNAVAEEKMHRIELVSLSWLFVNTEKYPYNNKNMRKALAYAINRKEITQHILQQGERPATSILGGFLALTKNPYFPDGDQNKAKQHLALALGELGISKEELPPFEASFYSSNQTASRLAQALQQQWKETLGIDVSLHFSEWPIHFTDIKKGSYQLGSMGWTSWLNDPVYILDTFRDRLCSINMSRWEHPIYQAYLAQSDIELNPEKRRELFKKAEELLIDEMPVIPLYFQQGIYFKNEHLKNVYVSPLKEIDFSYAYFEEEK
ncbi:MAG: peptide ABC transporter substrate-binding protein [Simkania negevensis]|nr:peptide ABC transporter substrate-binding protein [Simkania negevensis]